MSDAPPFNTQRHELSGGRLRLELQGELDYATAPFARRAVAAAQTTTPELVIDLSGIEKADVFGLAVLLKAWHTGPRNGCRIRLVRASRAVKGAWRAADMRPLGRLATPSHPAAA
jgi:anti-anti-sigma factor